MDLSELLFGAVALDAHGVAEILVALRHSRIDPKEAAEVDLAVGLDREAFEGDPAHRPLRHVSDRHAGVERSDQMLLRISETVRTSEFARFVDVDRESALHL